MKTLTVAIALLAVLSANPRPLCQETSASPVFRGVGWLKVGNMDLQIFASPKNMPGSANAPQWQFQYAPAFLPQLGPDNKAHVDAPRQLSNGQWETSMDLHVSTPELDYLAFKVVRGQNPGASIQPSNVRVWPVKWIQFSIPDHMLAEFPDLTLPRSEWNNVSSNVVRLPLRFPTKESADAFVARRDKLTLNYVYSSDAATTVEDSIAISSSQLRSSDLFARLNGLGEGECYVRRCDLRRLSESFRTSLDIDVAYESGERFDMKLTERLLTQLETTAIDALKDIAYDQTKWLSTFNGKDLQPDNLKKTLDKAFVLESDRREWSIRDDMDVDTHASFAKVFSGGGSYKRRYNEKELIELFRQHDITVEREGDMWVPKSVFVQRINKSKLAAEFNIAFRETRIGRPHDYKMGTTVAIGLAESNAWEAIEAARKDRVHDLALEMIDAAALKRDAISRPRESAEAIAANMMTADGRAAIAGASNSTRQADTQLEGARELVLGGDFDGARQTAEAAYKGYVEARMSYEKASRCTKAPGRIVKVEWVVDTGGEDKDPECAWIVRIGGNTQTLGCREKWLNDRHSGSFEPNIGISDPVTVVVGLADCPDERNCAADGQFKVVLHFADDDGRKWSKEFALGMQRFSTDGKGGNASDVREIAKVQRCDFD